MKIKLPIVFSGSVIPFAGATAPAGYLLCDGSAVSRTTYAALFAAIGTVHGSGDGSTTFHLPDYRGRFLRGSDNMGSGAAGRDPNAGTRTASNSGGATGATVGSVQSGEVGNHTHGGSYIVQGVYNGTLAAGGGLQLQPSAMPGNGGSESRPQNSNVNYIIKI